MHKQRAPSRPSSRPSPGPNAQVPSSQCQVASGRPTGARQKPVHAVSTELQLVRRSQTAAGEKTVEQNEGFGRLFKISLKICKHSKVVEVSSRVIQSCDFTM